MRDDPDYPVYQGDTDQKGHTRMADQFYESRRLFNGFSDKVFFVLAGLAALWLAVVALVQAVHSSWWSVLLILVFWGLASYLILPRLHQILTSFYVPAYFFGRTQTADGLLGDPVNLAFLADEEDLHTAFERAGWSRAEEITLKSSWRIVVSSLRKKSYPQAPVSPLMLFGRRQDFAYQQEVDGNPGKRHHIRFWRTPEGWKLPGGRSVEWVAAATYDNAVGLSLFTLQITHKVDSNTDLERDYVVSTLEYTNPETSVEVLEDFMTGYSSRNGGGDQIVTDGDLPVVDLHDVVPDSVDTWHEDNPRKHRRLSELAEKAPPGVWLAGALVTFVALIQVARTTYRIWDSGSFDTLWQDPVGTATRFADMDTGNGVWNVVLASSVTLVALMALLQVLLAMNVVRGRYLARQLSLVMLLLGFVIVAVQILTDTADTSNLFAVFVVMSSYVFAMLAYTSDHAVNYTYASRETRRERRRQRKQERAGGRRRTDRS